MKIEQRTADLEALTQSYGREIFARLGRTGAVPFSPSWWDERLMEWSMGDEAVKLQLFRFVDVLPLLRSPESIARHLREYFGEARERLPGWLTFGLRWLPRHGLFGRLLAKTAYRSAERLARKFIAGSNLNEALDAIARLRRRSLAFTIDRLGEATITEARGRAGTGGIPRSPQRSEPRGQHLAGQRSHRPRRSRPAAARQCLGQAVGPVQPVRSDRPGGHQPGRASSSAADPARRPRSVRLRQHRHGAIRLQGSHAAIFREVLDEDDFRDWPDVGIAIQAYLRDTAHDLEDLAAWAQRRGTPVTVRLVKGAYWDYETILSAQQGWPNPVWAHKWETDANYERLTEFLIDNRRWLRPAFGSHNVRSLARGLALAQLRGLPPGSIEWQMLYGMAEPIKDTLVRLGQRVRVYTPYGQLLPGMAYLVRRLLENTANESFLRASFTEHVPEEQLLRNPLEDGRVSRVEWALGH